MGSRWDNFPESAWKTFRVLSGKVSRKRFPESFRMIVPKSPGRLSGNVFRKSVPEDVSVNVWEKISSKFLENVSGKVPGKCFQKSLPESFPENASAKRVPENTSRNVSGKRFRRTFSGTKKQTRLFCCIFVYFWCMWPLTLISKCWDYGICGS